MHFNAEKNRAQYTGTSDKITLKEFVQKKVDNIYAFKGYKRGP